MRFSIFQPVDYRGAAQMLRRIRIAVLNLHRWYHWHMAVAHERNSVIRLIEARMASLRGEA